MRSLACLSPEKNLRILLFFFINGQEQYMFIYGSPFLPQNKITANTISWDFIYFSKLHNCNFISINCDLKTYN